MKSHVEIPTFHSRKIIVNNLVQKMVLASVPIYSSVTNVPGGTFLAFNSLRV